LAAVLWNGGISFGGVIAFIFADLIVLPILDIYRKYYGGRVALFIAGIFYVSMVLAAWAVEVVFGALHLIPPERSARIVEASVQLNYTTVLNILFLLLAGVLMWRFLKTGGPEMLKMMDMAPEQQAHLAKDPMCGMTVDPRTAPEHASYRGQTYQFCSPGCRAIFERDAARYAGTRAA
jgi:YHS domain-containing protein